MSSGKRKLSTFVSKIERKAPLTDAWNPACLLILMVLCLAVQPHLWVLSSRPCSKQTRIVVAKSCCVYVFGIVDVSAPVNFLYLLARPIVPYLDLVVGRITASQNFPILKVKRITWNVWPQKMFDAFAFSHIPKMHHWVPSTAHNYMAVNKLDTKDTIVVSRTVPLGGFACYS